MAVKKKRPEGFLDAAEFLAVTFEKTLIGTVDKMPDKCAWYCFGPGYTPEEMANLLDFRKFQGYLHAAPMANAMLPEGAIFGILFF